MAQKLVLEPGKTICFEGTTYRILSINGGFVDLVEVEGSKLNAISAAMELFADIDPKRVFEIADTFGPKEVSVTEEQWETMQNKRRCIEEMLDSINHDYTLIQTKRSGLDIGKYCSEFNCSRSTAFKALRQYIQSGRNIYSLVDGRRRENLSRGNRRENRYLCDEEEMDNDTRNMLYAYKQLKKGLFTSVREAYDDMLTYRYGRVQRDEDGRAEFVEVSKEAPSLRVFRGFIETKIAPMSVEAFFKGTRELRNSDRIRFGRAQDGCTHPGSIIEIDACELIVVVNSEKDRRKSVGKPVVYFAIDVYSCCIVGYYVGFENNSFLGATSLFANIFFKQHQLTNKNGDVLTPGGFIPDSIRVDQGSEWVSKGIRRMTNETEIDETIAPPAMGSMKGLVENSFLVYQKKLQNLGRGYGVIYHEYQSKHYEEACMMLEDIKRDIEDFIIEFNQKEREALVTTKEMVREEIIALPYKLWQFGIGFDGNPIWVTDAQKQRLLWSLLQTCTDGMHASVNLRGITIKRLRYISKERAFTNMLTYNHFHKQDKIPYEVRYDPRSVDCVWIKINGEIYQIPMAEDEGVKSFRNMTWFEYNMWFEDKKALSDKNKENALGEHLASHARRKELMGQAKKEQEQLGKNKTKTAEKIRKNRLAEQQEKRKQERLSTLNITEEEQRMEREEYIDIDLDEKDLIETVDENDDEMEDIDLAALL